MCAGFWVTVRSHHPLCPRIWLLKQIYSSVCCPADEIEKSLAAVQEVLNMRNELPVEHFFFDVKGEFLHKGERRRPLWARPILEG